MKILILTPLFPPDIGDPAPYVKELASRLTDHEVTVSLYGSLPESIVEVRMIETDKRLWLPVRIFLYTIRLLQIQHAHDLILVNNGPSTELPALLVALFRPASMLLLISDARAEQQSAAGWYKIVHSFLSRRIRCIKNIANQTESKRPEILPFEAVDPDTQHLYSMWWSAHLAEITQL